MIEVGQGFTYRQIRGTVFSLGFCFYILQPVCHAEPCAEPACRQAGSG